MTRSKSFSYKLFLVAALALTGFVLQGCDSDSGNGGSTPADGAKSDLDPSSSSTPAASNVLFSDANSVFADGPVTRLDGADVDGDDLVDLALIERSGPSVWLNEGYGSFSTRTRVPSPPEEVTDLALGDLDGDEDPDLVLVSFEEFVLDTAATGAPVRVLLNDGTGGFRDSGQRIGKNHTHSVALGDMNGDGALDIITGNRGPNRVYLNDRRGRFQNAADSLGGSDTSAMLLADLDGDRIVDIVAGNSGRRLTQGILSFEPDRVWFGRGTPPSLFPNSWFFSNQALGNDETTALAVLDIDGDGSPDLVAATRGPNRVYLNDGTGRMEPAGAFPGSRSTNALAVCDLDGDGDEDLVEGTDEEVLVWLNRGSGTFELSATFNEAAYSLLLVDLDRDLDPDLVVGSEAGVLIHFNISE